MKTSEKLSTNKETAQKVLNYLKEKNMSFCWLSNGRFLTQDDCIEILNEKAVSNDRE